MTCHPRGVAKGSDRDHSRWIDRSIAITNNMLCKGQGEKCYGSMAPPFEDAIPKRIVYTPVCPPEVSFSRVSKVTPSLSQGFRGCRGLAVAVPSFFGVSISLVCWSQSLLLSSQGHPFRDTSFGVFLLRSLVWHFAISLLLLFGFSPVYGILSRSFRVWSITFAPPCFASSIEIRRCVLKPSVGVFHVAGCWFASSLPSP